MRLRTKIARAAHQLRAMLASACSMTLLHIRNGVVRSSVVESDGDAPVVSLTTHGRRLVFAHLAIESIARGDLRPARLVLWLDPEDDRIEELPRPLRRLVARGLEVRRAPGAFGPHAKYFPQAVLETDRSRALVTSDDDVIHPRSWLRVLVAGAAASPGEIIAHRARVVRASADGTLAPYSTWPTATPHLRSPCVFALGVGGVLYPPAFLEVVRRNGVAFESRAPRADDVWLHFLAVDSGTPVRALGILGDRDTIAVRGHGSGGLWVENVDRAANDRQIRATYSATAVLSLTSAAGLVKDDRM